MSKCKPLTHQMNLSWGYLPVLITLLLGGCVTQQEALYAGVATGILSSILMWRRKGVHVPPIILYCTTGVLSLLTLIGVVAPAYYSHVRFPLLLEAGTLLPVLILFLNRKRFTAYMHLLARRRSKPLLGIGAEATVVSARVTLLVSLLHLAILLIGVAYFRPWGEGTRYILLYMTPMGVFLLSILFNQFGIHYFNHLMKQTVFIPIVDLEGYVIGKRPATEVIGKKSPHLHPVIRVAVASQGMLWLNSRSPYIYSERCLTDFPLECHLLYGETLQQGVSRLLNGVLATNAPYRLRFCRMHPFKNEVVNQLIYLFVLEADEAHLLPNRYMAGGKPWTIRQIEDNLHKGFFSSCFESEYEAVKEVTYTTGKYKES